MLKTQIQRIALSTATFITALILASSVSAAGSGRFEVTITNLTQSQIISPAVVTSHARDAAPLFVLGRTC